MIYSKTSEYAIRTLGYLASRAKKAPATIMEFNNHTGVPQAYLSKIFQCLVRAGILGSKSGPRGGYFLRVNPTQLTLLRVINALDDFSESAFSKCVMGRSECGDKNPCSLHHIWAKSREEMHRKLRQETIADISRMKKGTFINKKRRVVLSKRMQNIFGYETSSRTLS